MKETRCACFTGHRQIPRAVCKPLVQAIRREVARLAGEGITRFYAGGALGFDTLAALTVLEMRKTMPQLELYVVIPFAGQEARWPAEDRQVYRHILDRADHLEVLHRRYAEGCYHERNRYMVDHSERCIAYLTRQSGGTWYTCRYAAGQGRPVLNLAEGVNDAQPH